MQNVLAIMDGIWRMHRKVARRMPRVPDDDSKINYNQRPVVPRWVHQRLAPDMGIKGSLTSKDLLILVAVDLGAWVPLAAEMATGQFRVYMENPIMRNWFLAFVATQTIGLIVALAVKNRFWRTVLLVFSAVPVFLLPLLRPALATYQLGCSSDLCCCNRHRNT
jgi:hypothetical protein